MFKRFLNTILALLLFSAAGFSQTSFDVQSPSVVSQGEQFTVRFTANARIENFTPPTFSGAQVLAGPAPSQSSYTQWVNGKKTSTFEHTYTYVLLAGDQSVIAISPASVTINGNSYSSRPVTIEVVSGGSASKSSSANTQQSSSSASGNPFSDFFDEPQESDNITYGKADLFLRLHLSKTKVVKGEPIIATLKIYTRSGIAGFEDIKFPVFNGFWNQEIETPQNVNFTREKVGSQIYNSALLRKWVIMPQQTGTLTVDAAEITCQVQVMEKAQRGRSIFDDFFGTDSYSIQKKKLSTGTHNITVVPLPSGAPESFGGGVGRFTMNVHLSKDSLKSNDAASVVVEISGAGNLNLIETPSVKLPADFETYDVRSTNNFSNSKDGTQGKRTFEYPFIPRVEGEYKLDPITYSYYDLSQRKYVTLKSDTLLIKVSKGDGVTSNNYTDFATQRGVSNLGEDIRYIKSGNAALKKTGSFLITSWPFFAIIALIIFLTLLGDVLLKRNKRLSQDIVRTKNRRANKIARTRLHASLSNMKENKVQEFYAELHSALHGYIADKLAIPQADMQKDVIVSQLSQRGVDSQKTEEFVRLLDECEMVRYSPSANAQNMSEHYKKAGELISYFESKL